MSSPLQILFPNGQVEAVQVYIWDVNTLQPIVWTGAVTGGGGGGGGAVTIADGADTAEGFTTDAAVVGDVNGTISAKLRGLSKIWNDIWDSVNHRIRVDSSGVTQPVSIAATVNVKQPDNIGSGTVTSAASLTISTQNTVTLGVLFSGVFTGSIVFKGQVDNTGSNLVTISGYNPTTGLFQATVGISPTVLFFDVGGFQSLVLSGTASGTANINWDGSNVGHQYLVSNQGVPTNLLNAWPAKLTDGGNGPVTVKPASSPPVANDQALVVSLHPFSISPLQTLTTTIFAGLTSLGATQVINLLNTPSDMINVCVNSLGNTNNNLVFEAQSGDGVYRLVPLLAVNGTFAGQYTDGTFLSEGVIYTFNPSGYQNVRVRVTQFGGGQITGSFMYSPQGRATQKANQTYGLIDASPAPVASGIQPLSLTTDAKVRVEISPEEYVDFFGDFDLLGDGDNLGTPKFSSLDIGELF